MNAGTYSHERALYPGSPLSLTQLFTPTVLQEPVVAAYALLNELWRVPEDVSEPSVGAAKLNWWQQQLANTLDQAAHPAIKGVLNVQAEVQLPADDANAFIATLTDCLELGVYSDVEALWQRCLQMGRHALQIQLAILGASTERAAVLNQESDWAVPLALHYFLRLIHQFGQQDHCLPWPVPMNLQARHQVNPQNYAEHPEHLKCALQDLVKTVRQSLPTPAQLAAKAELPQLLPCLLLFALENRLLKRYQQQPELLLEQQQQRWRPMDTMSLWWNSQRLRKLSTALIAR
jgi:phytoene/squalene synthetase